MFVVSAEVAIFSNDDDGIKARIHQFRVPGSPGSPLEGWKGYGGAAGHTQVGGWWEAVAGSGGGAGEGEEPSDGAVRAKGRGGTTEGE